MVPRAADEGASLSDASSEPGAEGALPDPLAPVWGLSWRTKQVLGATAIRLLMESPEPVRVEFRATFVGDGHGGRLPYGAVIEEDSDGVRFGMLMAPEFAGAHTPMGETPPSTSQSSEPTLWSNQTFAGELAAGTSAFWVVFPDLAKPSESQGMHTGGHSLEFQTKFSVPVQLHLEGSREVLFVSPQSARGGTGAHTWPASAGFNLDEVFSVRTEASDVKMVVRASEGLGSLALDHPEGKEEWEFQDPIAPNRFVFTGRGGEYTGRIQWAGAGVQDGIYVVLAGLRSITAMAELEQLPSFS